jgi:ketosteroid isomerase-like protein
MRRLLVVLALIALALPVRAQSRDAERAIAASNERFESTFAAGDAIGMAAFYTADGEVLAPNLPPFVGQAAIQAFWQAGFAQGLSGIDLTTEEVTPIGRYAIERGSYALMVPGLTVDQGKYIVVWQKVNGAWKMHQDMFNSDLPLPAPARSQTAPGSKSPRSVSQ